MNRIEGRAKTVRELLVHKYALDFYQREYQWQTKQIEELLQDLENRFMGNYDPSHERTQVETYDHYFLGSIIINTEDGRRYIIDGQQRLTSLTLLLVYFHNLQKDRSDAVDVSNLIFSEKFGKKSFNLDVPERVPVMEALYSGNPLAVSDGNTSVRAIVDRYAEIESLFPETLRGDALPFFTDWLLENVELVEIVAYSDDDAYMIFETMNDRGLSLTPTEMLKGYLLAHIADDEVKQQANAVWKERMADLAEIGKEEDADFFKAWLRGRYAASIREREKGATNKDFEEIGTAYHRWVRDNLTLLRLSKSADFGDFIFDRFNRYTGHYMRLRHAAETLTPGLEYVFYNAYNGFTLQYPLALAPILPGDDRETADVKTSLVAAYIDIYVARRIVNYRTLGYSSIVYTMFNIMKELRDLEPPELAKLLREKVESMEETFEGVLTFGLSQQNRRRVHYILARMTHFIEQECGIESDFVSYVSRRIKKPFEIEHIWANIPERLGGDFPAGEGFAEHRNRIGGLLLVQQGFNQAYGADPYDRKVKHYFGQNLLARSLTDSCYEKNPNFLSFLKRTTLPFRPHAEFKKKDLEERQELYRRICELVWSPDRFEQLLGKRESKRPLGAGGRDAP